MGTVAGNGLFDRIWQYTGKIPVHLHIQSAEK